MRHLLNSLRPIGQEQLPCCRILFSAAAKKLPGKSPFSWLILILILLQGCLTRSRKIPLDGLFHKHYLKKVEPSKLNKNSLVLLPALHIAVIRGPFKFSSSSENLGGCTCSPHLQLPTTAHVTGPD